MLYTRIRRTYNFKCLSIYLQKKNASVFVRLCPARTQVFALRTNYFDHVTVNCGNFFYICAQSTRYFVFNVKRTPRDVGCTSSHRVISLYTLRPVMNGSGRLVRFGIDRKILVLRITIALQCFSAYFFLIQLKLSHFPTQRNGKYNMWFFFFID